MEEKGADFSGESTLQRKFELNGKVDYVRLQLAFSSLDLRRANRVMLLLQTAADRSYYLMIAITADGYLLFEEDREGPAVGARIDRNFLNNARHSIYYQRNLTEATLYIDREPVPLAPISARALTPSADMGANRVQIGGINTTDTRFAVFKSYSGCLSNIYIQVNKYIMKPLEEYMLFTKSGADNITVINPQGVRSAQCVAKFDISEQPSQEPMVNVSMSADNWVEEPPQRIPYIAKYVYDVSTKEDSTQVVFITLTSLFVIIVICCLIEVYRSHLAYKRRIERETDEDIIWSKEQATKMHESPGVGGQPYVYKALPVDDKKPGNGAPLVGILKNGSIKRNGELALSQLEPRIVEEDEEEAEDKEQQQQEQQKGEETKIEINEKINAKENAEDKTTASGGSPQLTNDNTTTKELENKEDDTKAEKLDEGK
ncbi:axotactin-like [Musca vetustissima]|uniref:axotactin-like n=1 Tax=Musca vetustissima TaxID=27455 RepID=UPI002AB6F91E|nr:axotactin-like [Musca vetustissima]